MLEFEANAFPLEPGIRLLEASAGTGKTFALAHLVLRLVTRTDHPLPLDQLLVVTYTEAAAAELRDRIAQRLQQALAALEPGSPPVDPVLQAWRDAQPIRPGALRRLQGLLLLALEGLDRADITTIHGFCRRSLQRQALEARLDPSLELESDDGERAAQVMHDYWQQQLLALPAGLLQGLLQQGVSLELLTRLLIRLDGDPALELEALPAECTADLPLADQLPELLEQRWQSFCRHWAERGTALEKAFCDTAADLRARGATALKPYSPRPTRNRAAELTAWIAGFQERGTTPGYDQLLAQDLLCDYFHPGPFCKVAAGFDPRGSLPERPLLESIAALMDGMAELVLSHALHWGRGELSRRRRSAGRMGFGDLLTALDPGVAGDQQSSLLAALADRYRCALIDEFQDTDPIQWRILERIFLAPPGRSPRHLLVMVGDPKQAIYRFRGGELATYRQARHQAEAVHTLQENRRSSASLVEALNRLMKPGLVRSKLPVPPVLAKAEKGELLLAAGESPLQLLPLGDDHQLPRQVAGLCLRLLQRNLLIRSRSAEGHELQQPLNPGDLCLLVSTHRQAEQLRQALERCNLPSRLVSRGDVFACEAATSLQRLLDALADPGHPGRQRLLAASALLGWGAEQLADRSAPVWEQLADRLSEQAMRLPRHGLLACLGEILRTEGVARLALGGRQLADLQQAAELVQEKMHQSGWGAAAAADWLRRLRLDPDRRVPESHQLNSTAADAAIAVVTVHRSKGLEYPVVICPYLWRASGAPTRKARELGRRWLPPGARAPQLDLHRSPHWGRGRQAALDDLEAQHQEDERLAYVACTRARHLLVLGWRDDPQHQANPLAGWLNDGNTLASIEPDSLPDPSEAWLPPTPEGVLEGGPLPTHRLDTSWGRSSYSSWAHGGSVAPQALEEGRDTQDETGEAIRSAATDSWSSMGPLALFPRGAGPGEALHRILERLDYGQPASAAEPRVLIVQELERAGLSADLVDDVSRAVEQLRHTPFGGALGGWRLAQLGRDERLNELNFDLPLAVAHDSPVRERAPFPRVSAQGLAHCFASHPGGGFGAGYAEQLRSLDVSSRGFLTGSIDLVFRHGRRWWVLDWKSNWLGDRDASGAPRACGPAHYSRRAMTELMAAAHYPLQAHLYLVALHRYLRWRLPHYSPAEHLGGYAYVFLRGVPGATSEAETLASRGDHVPGMVVSQPPLARLLSLDALLREGAP
ncbi:MAG: UvrD-helicase domain-containing protein [Cyanobacteriota bacterium]|nr:UvrD-helicase domain-containing protein [Cyanobacteriota bacterium]